jgi:hypothetical protein
MEALGHRWALVTASARSFSLLISGSSTDFALTWIWIWPPKTSVIAGAAPL